MTYRQEVSNCHNLTTTVTYDICNTSLCILSDNFTF